MIPAGILESKDQTVSQSIIYMALPWSDEIYAVNLGTFSARQAEILVGEFLARGQ